ncbi:MAG TPA: acyl carrier protein [Dongiaceae bacterium]|nr:acyl carrier protein [Dongiaceae bacterium]
MQRNELIGLLARLLKIDVARVTETARLTDLVADSFVLIETVVELQEELNITLVQEDLDGVVSVGQLLNVIQAKQK